MDEKEEDVEWVIKEGRREERKETKPKQKAMAELLGTDLINIPD